MVARSTSIDLQAQMRQAREDLDSHSEEMVKRARAHLDWRKFVAKHPLVTMGAAAAAGYLLAPRRIRCQCVDDKVIKQTVEHAMDRSRAVATASPAPGLVAGLASMLMAVLMREGLSLATQLVRNVFDSRADDAGQPLSSFNQHSATTASMGPQVTSNGEHP